MFSVREVVRKPTIGYLLFHNVEVYEAICYDLQYQMLFESQQRLHKQKFYYLLPFQYFP